MHSSTNLKEVLEVVVAKSVGVLNAKGSLLRILNKETRQFEVRAAYGLGERYLSKGPVTTEKLLPNPAEFRKVQIIKDIWNAPRVEYPQLAWDEGIRMIVDVPLCIKDQMVGLIRIYLTQARDFSEDELDFIITVAEQCACIIERVQLMESQQAQFTHLATQMERLSSLGRMAAGIAHEINNPLTGVLLYSSNMSKKVPPGGPLDESLKIIIRETQRCKKIIQGVLEFARDGFLPFSDRAQGPDQGADLRGQCFQGPVRRGRIDVIDVPVLDAPGPGNEPCFHQRPVLGFFHGDDPVGPGQVGFFKLNRLTKRALGWQAPVP